MAHILITGSKGQLGRALLEATEGDSDLRITATDTDELDICDAPSVEEAFARLKPDYVVNCAAYTAVDQAESEPDKAFAINATGVKNLAIASTRQSARMIHISTDYVFDGLGSAPYPADHPTSPLSVYGQSKLEGEIAALYHTPNVVIIRTSWLYHHGGKNFVNTILQHAAVKEELKVVCDQTGCPTNASDLAKAIVQLVGNPPPDNTAKVYHYANSGAASWYDFAQAIVKLAKIECAIHPILTSTLNLPAPRPAYSVLDTSAIRNDLEISIPWWLESLNGYLHHALG